MQGEGRALLLWLLVGFQTLRLSYSTCSFGSGFLRNHYRCSRISSYAEFAKQLENVGPWHSTFTLTLDSSHLDTFKATGFSLLNVSAFVFRNVKIDSFLGLGSERGNSAIENIQFINSSLPESWEMFKNFWNLKALEFSKISDLHLSRNFNDLPQTVHTISIRDSTITGVDADWISGLQNLAKVIVQNSGLVAFYRTMLPRPAPKLWMLDLK